MSSLLEMNHTAWVPGWSLISKNFTFSFTTFIAYSQTLALTIFLHIHCKMAYCRYSLHSALLTGPSKVMKNISFKNYWDFCTQKILKSPRKPLLAFIYCVSLSFRDKKSKTENILIKLEMDQFVLETNAYFFFLFQVHSRYHICFHLISAFLLNTSSEVSQRTWHQT